jgi:hypothetical protein
MSDSTVLAIGDRHIFLSESCCRRRRGLSASSVTATIKSSPAPHAKGWGKVFRLNSIALDLIPLAVNVAVLSITESLGYIHATSLRWALFYEGSLSFNTNLQLLTSSRRNFANGGFADLFFFISMALCCGASPITLVQNTYRFTCTQPFVLPTPRSRFDSVDSTPKESNPRSSQGFDSIRLVGRLNSQHGGLAGSDS